jgi:methylated-DNA-[protein]-cysteine S-methyltransferase
MSTTPAADGITLFETFVETPIGRAAILEGERGVVALGLVDDWPALLARVGAARGPLEVKPRRTAWVADRLRAYFDGEIEALDRVPVDAGGSAFQRRVWSALRRIPAGRTESYGALARKLGAPGSARAVGLAAARNPVTFVVPCHRLIGAGGELTGFAYGIERKRWLLEHEGARAASLALPGLAAARA